MLKTLLAATTALTLMSGVGFADSTYTHSTTESMGTGPSRDVDVSKSVRSSSDQNGTVIEKEKTVRKQADGDDAHLRLEIGRGHDMDQKDRTVTKSTEVSPTGEVTKNKTESTTIR